MKTLLLLLKQRSLSAVFDPARRRRLIMVTAIVFVCGALVFWSPGKAFLLSLLTLVLQIVFDA